MFSPGTWVSSTNKTHCHDITEILLKVALHIITLTHTLRELSFNLGVKETPKKNCCQGNFVTIRGEAANFGQTLKVEQFYVYQ